MLPTRLREVTVKTEDDYIGYKYVIQIRVNKTPVNHLTDSAAQATVISCDFFQKTVYYARLF